jgi:hypothetical protein
MDTDTPSIIPTEEAAPLATLPATPPLPDNEIVVTGHRVVFRTQFPAGQYHDLPELWDKSRADNASLADKVNVAKRFIASWELPGAVDSLDYWATLNTFSEMQPILRHINSYVVDRLLGLKN